MSERQRRRSRGVPATIAGEDDRPSPSSLRQYNLQPTTGEKGIFRMLFMHLLDNSAVTRPGGCLYKVAR
jgi:hypothetical protein